MRQELVTQNSKLELSHFKVLSRINAVNPSFGHNLGQFPSSGWSLVISLSIPYRIKSRKQVSCDMKSFIPHKNLHQKHHQMKFYVNPKS